jgi:hypothetical protein
MAVVTDTRTLRDSPGGNRLTDAFYGHKCSVLDQNPASPATASWLQIRLDNDPNQPVGWISADAVDPSHDAITGSLSKDSFADYCVLFEKAFLSSSLYLMAVAELRTQITVEPPAPNAQANAQRGAFALTSADWAYGLKVPGYPFNYKDADIDNFVAQIDIFGAMAQSAQSKITSLRNETPSFVGLYLAQIVGASIANTLLSAPTQKVTALVAAADANDLLKEGVDKATVLTRYNSLLGTDIAAAITSSLANDMQKAIDTVQPFIAKAGGMLTSSPTAPISSPGTTAKINLLSPRILPSRRQNATLIVQRFQQAGFGPDQQVAALAAAIHESNLKEDSAVPDPTPQTMAYGLFQCRIPGVGSGHDPNILKTADGNIATMISYIKSSALKQSCQKFVSAADLQGAIQVFINDFERPANAPAEIADCIKIAKSVTS